MATKKYQVEKATIDKIKKLFAYRRITDLLKISGLDKDKEFVSNLINLQYQIYMLDGYLESQWELNKEELLKYWEAIMIALKTMGIKPKKSLKLVEEIEAYEKIERNCRKDQWPTSSSMKEFYITKSCDVRLIRHLIYQAHPDLENSWKENAWNYYDIITEINDDITDVNEDLNTFNGNRYLIAILRKGAEKTYKQYHKYLTEITQKANEYFSEREDRGSNKQLSDWTMDRSIQTLKLLESNFKAQNLNKLSTSLLLGHMK